MKKTSKTNEVTRRLATLFVFAVVFFIGKNVKATEQATVTISVVEQKQSTEEVVAPEQVTEQTNTVQNKIMYGNGTINANLPDGTPISITVSNGALEAKFGTKTYVFRKALNIVGSVVFSNDGFIHLSTFDFKYYIIDPVTSRETSVWKNWSTQEYVPENSQNAEEVRVAFFIDSENCFQYVSGNLTTPAKTVTKNDFERIMSLPTPIPEEPTTETPVTEIPTTEELTTEVPATEDPTTEEPTTEVPTTEEPTTEVATTQEVTTEAPTTEAPATEAPTTEAPTTEVPATETPTTEVPSTEVPATETPTTEVPTTEVPATEVPTTEEATTEIPKTEEPTTEIQQPKEVKVVEGSVVKVEVIQAATTEVLTTQEQTAVVSTSEPAKVKTYYRMDDSDGKYARLMYFNGQKEKTICKVRFNKTKRIVKFHGIKYKNVKFVTFSTISKQIILIKKTCVSVIPRKKWQNGKTYTEKILHKGKCKVLLNKRNLAYAISDKEGKVKGISCIQAKVVKKK